MKRFLCVILAVVLLCGGAGCAGGETPDDSIKDAPEFIANMFNQMNELAKKNNFKFKAWGYDEGVSGPSFVLQYTGKDAKDVSLLSFSFQNETDPSNGFYVSGIFQDQEEQRPDYLQDIITALMMTLKPSLSLQDALTAMQKLMDSRPTKTSETRYSDIVEMEGYKLWFEANSEAKSSDNFQESFNLRKSDKLFFEAPEDASGYIALTADQEVSTSGGIKYQITGKVNNFKLSKWETYSLCEVEGKDGQKAIIATDFGFFPIEFEIGKTYTFFGESVSLMSIVDLAKEHDINIPYLYLTYAE